ncbi:hypothetical protein GCM10025864_09900 [Luteimicrobium album]|uniref:AraC-type arabinose-binding/dimerisation domain-containing protein n=1 Tax=Luteimicrobium album TaxID=1054550 RepID=A0ABQ6HXK2_9MICO|nr:AraC family ligand binding domain-containing protein [Luteimicrobium album]GMA23231.1 hypothetical protein GCM10025864_09900 [Luteimicrobium album]
MSVGAIGITRFEMERGQQFRRHVHEEHQLAWVSRGVLMVEVGDRYWVLPPSLALWVPAGTWHATIAVHEAVMEGVYVEPAATDRWAEPTVVAMTPLARELLGYLGGTLRAAERGRAERVLLDVLEPVDGATIDLPMPSDDRARAVAQLVLGDPGGTPRSTSWAARSGRAHAPCSASSWPRPA